MWVDDLRFFLKIEGLFMVFEFSLLVCVSEILLVVGEDVLWVWVSNESVSAASLSAMDSLITSG